ncbi:MAG: TVP38/TMEM64 family protein [Halanaeroarchaeum sp.]
MRVSRRRTALGLAALGVLVVALLLRPSAVITHLRAALASPWFPVVLVGLYGLRPLLGWPITLLSALVGFRYGLIVGVPIALAGAVLTSLLPYGAGRLAPETGRYWGRVVTGSRAFFDRTGGTRGVLGARLLPLPAEPVSAAAGTGGVSVGAFVLGTLVGELPWTIAAVWVGHSMATFALSGVGLDWRVLLLGAVVAAIVLAGPVYGAARERR